MTFVQSSLEMNNVMLSKKFLVTSLCLLLFVAGQAAPAQKELTGRWQVKFTFAGRNEMHLIFDSQAKGSATFLLLDTAADSKPEISPRPAAWLQTTNERVGFSGEVELPIGTCCRETGTLIFKGKFSSNSSISGRVIFVASTEEEENPIGYRALIGTFSATRVLDGR